jgi:hypothetical protein
MRMRGIVQTAALEENPPGSDTIEMTLRVQGVGPGQPRTIIIPFDLLLQDESLDPEAVAGHGFEAEVVEAAPKRWVVVEIAFAERRVLRSPQEE